MHMRQKSRNQVLRYGGSMNEFTTTRVLYGIQRRANRTTTTASIFVTCNTSQVSYFYTMHNTIEIVSTRAADATEGEMEMWAAAFVLCIYFQRQSSCTWLHNFYTFWRNVSCALILKTSHHNARSSWWLIGPSMICWSLEIAQMLLNVNFCLFYYLPGKNDSLHVTVSETLLLTYYIVDYICKNHIFVRW